jgi:Ca2+-binding EF-hand superfamily protein
MSIQSKNWRVLALGAGALVIVATAGAFAYAQGWGHDGRAGMGRHMARQIEQMDANKDGSLTRAEIEAFQAVRAKEIDADKDGIITAAEFVIFQQKERERRAGEFLKAMDKNGDGRVSVDEFEAGAAWRLARFDRNGDGKIETREMRHHEREGQRHRGDDRR